MQGQQLLEAAWTHTSETQSRCTQHTVSFPIPTSFFCLSLSLPTFLTFHLAVSIAQNDHLNYKRANRTTMQWRSLQPGHTAACGLNVVINLHNYIISFKYLSSPAFFLLSISFFFYHYSYLSYPLILYTTDSCGLLVSSTLLKSVAKGCSNSNGLIVSSTFLESIAKGCSDISG